MRALTLLVLFVSTSFGCRQNDATLSEDEAPESERRANLTTPYGALDHYLSSLKEGSLEGVQQVLLNADDFYVPDVFPLDSFSIVRQDTLTADQAAEYLFIPQPQAGDVEIDVREYFSESGEQMYTYHFRNVGGRWRIISHSAWGVDVFDEEDFEIAP